MGIGKNVQRLREARGLTFEALAKAVETNAQTISQMEKRDAKTSKFASQFARFFEVSVESLLGDDFSGNVDAAGKVDDSQERRRDVDKNTVALVYLDMDELTLITHYREAGETGRRSIRVAASVAIKRGSSAAVGNQP